MTYKLATRFGRNQMAIQSAEPLDDDALRARVPSIFADEAHGSRSGRYVYVPTIKLVQGLRNEGFMPFFACQARPRDSERIGHTKHMIRMRRANDIEAGCAAEVIIVNSHDGTSAYQMFAGMLRFVCTNSLIAGDKFEEVRVPHKGHIQDHVIEGAYTIAKDFPRLIDAANYMQQTALSIDESRAFARAALTVRYDEDDTPPIEADRLLRVRREADRGGDLWRVFNTIQENIIAGGINGHRIDQHNRIRRTTTRPIHAIDQTVKINRALWTLAEEMQRIKQAA
jgi:hypothetical protein